MHYCPECGQACYCHGDIDDCVVETEKYSAARCTHPRTGDCDARDDDFWDPRDDEWDDPEEPAGAYWTPMPDPDDLELGPVVALFCTSCKRHTEHVVCASDGDLQERRCSQCFAWSKGVPEPVIYDPTLHHQMTADPEGLDSALPF